MLLKVFALLLSIGSCLSAVPVRPKINVDHTLIDFMLQPFDISGNAALNQYCFNRYLVLLKDIVNQYELDYNGCIDTFNSQLQTIDTKYVKPLENITEYAELSCQALQKCGGEKYVEAFECYALTVSKKVDYTFMWLILKLYYFQGSEQSRILYSLSADAVQYSVQIKDEYRAAESKANECVNYAERVYKENTANTYEELSRCLDGNIPATTLTDGTDWTT